MFIYSELQQDLRAAASTESDFYLKKAAEYLDAKYGAGYTDTHPDTTIKLATLYAIDAHLGAFLLNMERALARSQNEY